MDEAVGRVNNNLNLFTANSAGTFLETPKSAGGLLIPLIYIDAFIQGRQLTTLPGGFNQTVIEWKENIDYNILTTPASRIFDVIPSTDAVVVNMYAYDHGERDRPPDVRYYDVIRPSKGGSGFEIDGTTGGSTTAGAQGGNSASVRLSSGLGLTVAFTLFVAGFS